MNEKVKLKVEYVKLEELIPFELNARTHSKEQVGQIVNSIGEFDFVNPILVGVDNMIIAGHGRLMAAKKAGLETVPIIRLPHLDYNQCMALSLADNKIADNAGWDEEKIVEILGKLEDAHFNIDILGFSNKELENYRDEFETNDEELEFENEVPDFVENPVARRGDVWILGDHRLLCGDATSQTDVEKVMDGEKAQMVFTDPPYNVNYESANTGKIINDNMSDNEFLTFLIAAFKMIVFSLKPGGAFYICHADSEGLNFRKAVKSVGLLMKQCIIWVKNSFVLGRQVYLWQHEPILYGWKDGAAHYFTDDRTKSTVIDDWKDTDFSKMKKIELIEFLNKLKTEQNVSTSIIREDKPKRNPDHPTMKPIRLCARCIQNSCRRNEKVIDLFGGSGSTLIACEQINRSAYLMELDPKFCDVIVRRYIQTFHDSKNIILIRNGQKMTFEDLEF